MKTLILNFLIVATITAALCGLATAQKPVRVMGPNLTESEFNASTVSDVFRVFPGQVRSHWVYMTAGSYTNVELQGDGDTDLDLYVYDGNGNLIASRTSSSDIETAELEIYRSGYFCIQVANRGNVYNDYRLFVRSY